MKTILLGHTEASEYLYNVNKCNFEIVDELGNRRGSEVSVHHTSQIVVLGKFQDIILCDNERFDKHLNFVKMLGCDDDKLKTMNLDGSIIPISHILENRKKSIFVNTMPKSGTSWIDRSLRQACRMRTANLQGKIFLNVMDKDETLNPNFVANQTKRGSLNVTHLNYNHANAELIRNALKNENTYFIVHIRDPRQAIVSWIYYEDKHFKGDPNQIVARGYEEGYFNLTFHQRIDIQLEYRYIEFVKWVANWRQFVGSLNSERCMISTHEQLTESPIEFNEMYREFLNMQNNNLFLHETPKIGSFNFRLGESIEWKNVIRDDQIMQMTNILDEYNLLDFFS